MKIYDNGTYRDMTAEEVAAIEEARERAEAEERHRPFTFAEVMEKFVRAQINSIAADDATAYRMKEFYPKWEAGHAYTAGVYLVYGGEFYRVLQAHTSQESWLPGAGTESLYVRIDEVHDGTKYDPIPYGGNMANITCRAVWSTSARATRETPYISRLPSLRGFMSRW